MRKTLLSVKAFIGIGFLIGCLLFQEQILTWYDKNFVNTILDKFQSNTWNCFLMVILVGLSLLFFLSIIRSKQKIRIEYFLLSILIVTIYCYYRFFTDRYCFAYCKAFPEIKYCDYLIMFSGGIILIWLYNCILTSKEPQSGEKPFIVDIPVLNSINDSFGRRNFAKRLSEKIQSKLMSESVGALAIGINGPWGAGKTSFTNLIKEYIDFENRLVIDFNPWRSSSPNNIIEDFFELLISELKYFDPKLSKTIASYAKTLTKIDKNIVSKSLEAVSEYIFETPNKNKTYDLINASIKKTKKQIIIFIDDIDRLDKKEIIEVLRIIRNTASFNSVVYVVSYDKSYVLEAIKEFNPHNYKYFLEKIFQFEFLLPKCNSGVLSTNVKTTLITSLPEYYQMIDAAVHYRSINGKSLTNRTIVTQRDVVRLCNALLFEIESIIDNVNFIDFYFVQLLKLKFEQVYKFISDHRELIFIQENQQQQLRRINEKYLDVNALEILGINLNRNEGVIDEEKNKTVFEAYIDGLDLTDINKELIVDLMKELMKEKEFDISTQSKDAKSFVNYDNFEHYFNIELLPSTLPLYQLEKFRLNSYENFKKIIFNLIKEDKLSEVINYLEKKVDFSTITEWKNHLNILMEIGKYQMIQNGPYGINYRQIIDVLNYPLFHPENKFFQFEEDYINYIKDFFKNAPDPYIFESTVLDIALNPSLGLKAMSIIEIKSQLYLYFENYCNDHKEVTPAFSRLRQNCNKSANEEEEAAAIEDKAQALYVTYVKENLKGRQLTGYIRESDPGSNKFYVMFNWLKDFFPDTVDFENYLQEAPNLKIDKDYYDEFVDFYNKFKDNNYLPVDFEFRLADNK